MSRLLHIGWQKSASTLLQAEIARRSPASQQMNYAIFQQHNLVLDVAQGKTTRKEAFAAATAFLQNHLESFKNQELFLSDERISQWRGTHASRLVSAEETYAYQELWADILHTLFPERKILINCRKPESWLKSLYAQDVKCGGALCHLPFAEWCEGNREHLIAATDIDRLSAIYRQRFGDNNVIILPYELFTRNKAEVKRILADEFSFPVEDAFFESRSNASLPPYANELLRRFQAMIEAYGDALHIPDAKKQHLRDHLFWFINHGAVNSPRFPAYMQDEFPQTLAALFGNGAFLPEAFTPDMQAPPALVETMSAHYARTRTLPLFRQMDY